MADVQWVPSCRFCAELAGQPRNSEFHALTAHRMPSRVEMPSPGFAAFPVLGPIAVGHSVVVPIKHATSMALIHPEQYGELEAALRQTIELLRQVSNGPVIAYEHGPTTSERHCGACVDHAHIQVLPARPDTAERIRSTLRQRFDEVSISELSELHRFAEAERDYLFVQDADGKRTVYPASLVPSQYLRRLTAEALGVPERWDWRANLAADGLERSLAELETTRSRLLVSAHTPTP